MAKFIKNIKSEIKDQRSFGVSFGIILLIISGVLFWKEMESFQIFLTIGIILFLTAMAIPFVLKPFYWIWMILSDILGRFMTLVILSLLFYVIFTSIGLTLRLFGKQFLDLKFNKSKNTYWNYCSNKREKSDYEKQF